MHKFTSVAEFLAEHDDERRASIDALRSIVIDAHPGIDEIIKWNSPSYALDGIDRLTINAAGTGAVRLVLHLGTEIAEHKSAATKFAGDPDGLLTWHSDIRASFVMPPAATLAEARQGLVAVVRAWLAFGAQD
jgi:hypothetical protein